MSDSFAELWSATAPINSNPAPQKLGSIQTQPRQQQRPAQNDVFSLLGQPQPSYTSSRPITPQPAKPASPATKSKADAFSGLFSSSNGADTSKLTIAERAAKVEKERLERIQKVSQPQQQPIPSAWDGLDSLASSSSAAVSSTTRPVLDDDDWGFGAPASIPKSQPQPKVLDDDWGLGDFGSNSASPAPQPVPSQSKQALWDLNEFSSPASESRGSQSLLDFDHLDSSRREADSPGRDFDFGDREYNDGNDDNILGVLAQPVVSRQPSSYSTSPDPSPTPNRPISRAPSPPPHILGQLVQMGFSVQQAKIALASTDTGLDVQAAAEILISNGAADDYHEEPPQHPQRRPPPRSRQNSERPARQGTRDTPSPSSTVTSTNVQADKLLSQASEIGLSIFNRANAIWKEGKEKAQKAYEERLAAAAAGGSTSSGRGTPAGSTRPKWMQEAEEHGAAGGFSDNEPTPRKRKPRPRPEEAALPLRREPEVDLFSSDSTPEPAEPQIYQSRWRHAAEPSPASSSRPTPPPAPKPKPKPKRPQVTASPSALSTSSSHKTTGGEKFKLGQYGDAETAYTLAIDSLPQGHTHLIPLYNNRALTRLRTGDFKGAEGDATAALFIIGDDQDDERDALVKAWKRRAEALEGREKWEEAGRDWERVAGAEWAGANVRGEGVRGAGRCRKMANPPPKAAPKPAKPKPRPVVRETESSKKAVEAFRATTEAAEAEDAAKHSLKDTVDARLTAWKAGKETNLRGLLAGLDSVLWPELGVPKVGMAELISEKQVKIRYMKVIGKVHPDKLNEGNSTLEQRMIAAGVFGVLNEAWNGFKP